MLRRRRFWVHSVEAGKQADTYGEGRNIFRGSGTGEREKEREKERERERVSKESIWNPLLIQHPETRKEKTRFKPSDILACTDACMLSHGLANMPIIQAL